MGIRVVRDRSLQSQGADDLRHLTSEGAGHGEKIRDVSGVPLKTRVDEKETSEKSEFLTPGS